MSNLTEQEFIKSELLNEYKGNVGIVESIMQTYRHVIVNNEIIEVCRKKPEIVSTILYDDETEKPELTKELFLNRNKLNYIDTELNESDGKFFIFKNFESNIKNWERIDKKYETHPNFQWKIRNSESFREANEKEIEAIKCEVSIAQKKWNQRLENYWKRYKSKIRVSGYWVNR